MARGAKLAEQGLTHSLKKAPGSKKRKKHATESSTDVPSTAVATGTTASVSKSNGASNGIKNSATASLTARVLNEENEKKKKRKMMGHNENIESLYTKDKKDGAKADFMTRGFSIPTSARR
jgi:hypothetical protein